MAHPLGFSRTRIAWAALCIATLLGLTACSTTLPEGMTAVTPFDLNRYQGKWYEIARLDHTFERGLTDVSATYRVRPDGSVEVTNRGYDAKRNDWKQVVGNALFLEDANRGSLKVSFFGPFYAGYHVVALYQQSYRWALVAGPSREYFWILARDKQLSADTRAQLLALTQSLKIDIHKLIWVAHTRQDG